MSEAENQQIMQSHFSHVLQEVREASRGAPSRWEFTSSATQKPAGVDNGWERIIDSKLIEWGRDPSQLDEEGTVTPSKQTIQFAIGFAQYFRNNGLPAPTRVVPDAHGGIVFEFHQKGLHETFRLAPGISLEYCIFENCRLVQRQEWPSLFVPGE